MSGGDLDERAKLRRNDRTADEGWIREFLHESAVLYEERERLAAESAD